MENLFLLTLSCLDELLRLFHVHLLAYIGMIFMEWSAPSSLRLQLHIPRQVWIRTTRRRSCELW